MRCLEGPNADARCFRRRCVPDSAVEAGANRRAGIATSVTRAMLIGIRTAPAHQAPGETVLAQYGFTIDKRLCAREGPLLT